MPWAWSVVRRRVARALVVLAALGAGVSCGEYVTGPGGDAGAQGVRGIALGASGATLTEGDTLRVPVVAFDRLGAAFATLPAGVVIEWTSANESVATVSATGLVRAVGVGTTRITARAVNIPALPPVSMDVVVRFRARLVPLDTGTPRGIVGEPLAAPVRVGVVDPDGAGLSGIVVRFVVRGPAGDTTYTDVTSDEQGVASLPLTLGQRPGEYRVEARLRDAADVTITIVVVARAGAAAQLEVVGGSGQSGVVGEALPQPLAVRVSDRFGNPVADSMVTFAVQAGAGSVTPATVRTDANGVATAGWTLGATAGTQRVTATLGTLTPAAFDAVARPGAPATIVLTPDTLAFATLGRSARLAVAVADRFGNAITDQAIGWSSSAPGVATVDATGEVRAAGEGTARVIATVAGIADTTIVTVRQVARSIEATPASLALEVGGEASVAAVVRDSGGAPLASAVVAWRSDDESVATVSQAGVVHAVGAGSTRLVASAGDVADTVAVVVTPVDDRRRVEITPGSITLEQGSTGYLMARVYDARGTELSPVDLVWTSSDPSIASVAPNADFWNIVDVSGIAPGTALVIATSGDGVDTAVVTIQRPPIASIVVEPQRITLAPGQGAQLTARALDRAGRPVEGATFTWRSSDEQVAVVSQSGVVTGVAAGLATITAESEGVTGSASSATIATCGPTGLTTFGTAMSLGPPDCVLRLNSGANQGSGGAWSTDKHRLVNGFDIEFTFRISDPGNGGADGFAFIVQDVSGNYIGGGGGGIGYHGLPRSIAIEFDTWHNPPGEADDPDDNHISVHTNGLGANDVDERFSIGRIDASAMPFALDDGRPHTVRVRYVPGTLQLFLDGATEPALTMRVDLGNMDGAGGSILDSQGRAWIGFTAATGFAYETHDILSWRVQTAP